MKIFKSKKGAFRDVFTSPQTVLFFLIIFFVIIYLVNFLLNQAFGIKVLQFGKTFNFLLVGLGIIGAFYIIIRKGGSLDKLDFFTMLLIAGGIFALIYYIPVLFPDIYTHPTNSVLQFLNTAYTNPNSPLTITYNAASTTHRAIQSVIPIP